MYKRFSDSVKRQLAKKCLTLKGESLKEFARYHGVGYSSLRRWVSQLKQEIGYNSPRSNLNKISQSQKRAIVSESSALEGSVLGAYCRERGIYIQQIYDWRNEMSNPTTSDVKTLSDRKKIEKLERENRKLQKRLKEANALIELQKKIDHLLGEKKDEK